MGDLYTCVTCGKKPVLLEGQQTRIIKGSKM